MLLQAVHNQRMRRWLLLLLRVNHMLMVWMLLFLYLLGREVMPDRTV
jgi:hypothetical protein